MENKRRIYLVDFGMCRKWRLDDGKTRSPREKAPFRGTIRYASSRALTQQECGPTDDLIGWLYSVIELYQGHLPWAKISDPQELIRLKAEMPITALCEAMPPPFFECFEYANSLGLTVIPDYEKVQKCLHDCLPETCNANDPYDWE
uniref:Protein kinase domain-containing protein n=1 Tax=Panagrolaimus superbus TaxID=310955 RepID=A0A914Y309_9BILA